MASYIDNSKSGGNLDFFLSIKNLVKDHPMIIHLGSISSVFFYVPKKWCAFMYKSRTNVGSKLYFPINIKNNTNFEKGPCIVHLYII
jgi:hypothetical protein